MVEQGLAAVIEGGNVTPMKLPAKREFEVVTERVSEVEAPMEEFAREREQVRAPAGQLSVTLRVSMP